MKMSMQFLLNVWWYTAKKQVVNLSCSECFAHRGFEELTKWPFAHTPGWQTHYKMQMLSFFLNQHQWKVFCQLSSLLKMVSGNERNHSEMSSSITIRLQSPTEYTAVMLIFVVIWILADFAISINSQRKQTVPVLLFQCLFCTLGFILNLLDLLPCKLGSPNLCN